MDSLHNRRYIILAFMGLVIAMYAVRLFSLQVLSEEYANKAKRYVVRTKPVVPPRGNVYNRYGDIYVTNQPMFNLLVTPYELDIKDTTVLETYLHMSREEIDAGIEKARAYSKYKESVLARYIDPETYGKLLEETWDFSGISFSTSTKRFYRYPVGANVLGYISEVSQKEIENSAGTYLRGDMIGKAGVERAHDTTLRGLQGYRKVLKNVLNREVGSYKDGAEDKQAIKGQDILLSIDTELQAYGELMMQNKKGSIVAIEPKTGEILSFVSAPSYDPDALTGRELIQNWRRLRTDTLNPLYNRPLMARYPPGSIFKLPVALAALQEGIIHPNTYYGCGGGFKRNKGKPGCRFHVTPLKLDNALKYSCNSYFAATYMDYLHAPKFGSVYEGYNSWSYYMAKMGIGQKLGVDIPYEVSGLLPSVQRYDKWYGEGRWQATTIISNAIGQGELLMTPLQMAHMVAIIANRGQAVQPHFVRAVRPQSSVDWEYLHPTSEMIPIDRAHFETVGNAMEQVVATGTARRAFISDIVVCGKTGSVQNPHGDSHATFVAFAPKDDPKIAIAVVVENAGGGGSWAAPMAALMIEQYLRGEVVEKKYEEIRLKNARFIP